MTREQIISMYVQYRIEFTEDNKAYIHAGGSYPLIVDVIDGNNESGEYLPD
jgi:hypothetical protein